MNKINIVPDNKYIPEKLFILTLEQCFKSLYNYKEKESDTKKQKEFKKEKRNDFEIYLSRVYFRLFNKVLIIYNRRRRVSMFYYFQCPICLKQPDYLLKHVMSSNYVKKARIINCKDILRYKDYIDLLYYRIKFPVSCSHSQ